MGVQEVGKVRTVFAQPMFRVVREAEEIIYPVAALAQAFEQHVTRPRVDGHKTAPVCTEIVVRKLAEIPVFELTAEVAFGQVAGEGDSFLWLRAGFGCCLVGS